MLGGLRVQVKKDNPDAGFGDIGKLLGAAWKEVTASEKAKFEEMAKKDKVRACMPVLAPTHAPRARH